MNEEHPMAVWGRVVGAGVALLARTYQEFQRGIVAAQAGPPAESDGTPVPDHACALPDSGPFPGGLRRCPDCLAEWQAVPTGFGSFGEPGHLQWRQTQPSTREVPVPVPDSGLAPPTSLRVPGSLRWRIGGHGDEKRAHLFEITDTGDRFIGEMVNPRFALAVVAGRARQLGNHDDAAWRTWGLEALVRHGVEDPHTWDDETIRAKLRELM